MSMLAVPLTGQSSRAPGTESIRQEDLRADLFFLAGDSMRGRLTDTEENRRPPTTSASRFERLGLKPAGPNGSYFQPYNLMTATLGEGNAARRAAPATAPRAGTASTARSSTRSASARAAAARRRSSSPGFGISAPQLQYDDYAGDVKGQIVLVLDHEPGERDPNSPFDGVVTVRTVAPRGARRWRRRRRARSAVLFVSDVHNHPGAGELRAGGAHLLAGETAADPELHAGGVGRPHSHPGRADLAGAGGVARRPAPASRSRSCRRRPKPARGFTPVAAARRPRRAAHRGRSPHRAGPQRRRAPRGQRSEAQGRVGDRLRPLRPQRRGRHADLQRRRRQRIGHGGAASKSPRRTRWRRRRAGGRSAACSSRRGTPRSAGCSARGRTPSSRSRR